MLAEAMEIISALFDGELVDYRGEHFEVDAARLWDLPSTRVPVGLAVGGPEVSQRCAALADHLIAVEPDAALVEAWNGVPDAPRVGSEGTRAIGQIPISWDPDDADAAVRRAHHQFRWFGGGWAVNSELPTTASFAAASQFVRHEDVASSIPCGPDLGAITEGVQRFWKAGFTDVALVQVDGSTNDQFLAEAAGPLLDELRSAAD